MLNILRILIPKVTVVHHHPSTVLLNVMVCTNIKFEFWLKFYRFLTEVAKKLTAWYISRAQYMYFQGFVCH